MRIAHREVGDLGEAIRQWAHDNAFTLIFMCLLSVATWAVIVFANYIWS